MSMPIFVYVDPTTAILECKTQSGYLPVEITEEFLESLNEEERKILAEHVGNTEEGIQKKGPGFFIGKGITKLHSPTLERVQWCLSAEAHRRQQLAETYEKQILAFLASSPVEVEIPTSFYDGRVTIPYHRIEVKFDKTYGEIDLSVRKDPRILQREAERDALQEKLNKPRIAEAKEQAILLWQQGIEEQKKKEEEEKEAKRLRKETLDAFVNLHAPTLIPRYQENLLPKDELLLALRNFLFAPLDSFKRYEKIKSHEIRCDCSEDDHIKFEAEPAVELSADEFETLTKIREKAPENTSVVAKNHRGYCAMCDRNGGDSGRISRKSILVTTTWHGIKCSREYALPL